MSINSQVNTQDVYWWGWIQCVNGGHWVVLLVAFVTRRSIGEANKYAAYVSEIAPQGGVFSLNIDCSRQIMVSYIWRLQLCAMNYTPQPCQAELCLFLYVFSIQLKLSQISPCSNGSLKCLNEFDFNRKNEEGFMWIESYSLKYVYHCSTI